MVIVQVRCGAGLTRLDLRHNGLGDGGAVTLAAVLSVCVVVCV